jgi:putative FmdB family regulatory protein
MPLYPYKCDGCSHEFDEFMAIADYKPTLPCPDCGKEANRLFTPLIVRDEDHMTVGSLADKNASKFSEAKKAELKDKHTAYLRNRPAPTPPRLIPNAGKPKRKKR